MSASPAAAAHLDLGGITLDYLPDGEFRAEPGLAYPRGDDALAADGPDVLDDDGMLVLSVGAVLATTADRRVLIDAGIGDRTIPLVRPGAVRDAYMRGGALLESLAALGLEPADIDAVLITHLHADHIGWIGGETVDGVPTFPNAEYWLAADEWDFWSRPENGGEAVGPRPNELRLIDARRRHFVEGEEPVAGVRVVRTPGHTPGRVGFAVEGSRLRALVVGDAVHCPAEILRPELVWVGDHDGAEAVRTRQLLAERVGGGDVVLVGPHFPDAVFRRYDPSAPHHLAGLAT
ncbi:MBL fold metallo-hydrolase [Rathayibacter sp. VKM Ac-2762]|uniref:MBL fold metallo-hydrolase n=1 Tax=Rathayibacter sp. VKM Ac-2762 TaxID=2609254 RepID=UPI00132F45B4|nr:MBL fold metallo-hydrolase [Rathayibacter sp. VKM Ac-2762]QHF21669.1 MBL fold metallo-hydrolase [Rathayibacter sp. VKM Ac-2762]